ncbi:uncharacterized protein N7482_004032 [Penicillium canariense]|uniref:Aminotransferase class I/classII large domain-containing protein n=1 Tax=Penicillium canariense TaxID=189055 RepID=A0A9W9I7V3_9EURO|nr:uncharacterized protein N7482_004032 [Penicillium canariense]KAJ5168438.1 hypothetical protein N7482_004032 [Penicillium canariense]
MANLRPIDLFRGWPAPDLIPVQSFQEAAARALSDKITSGAGFGYGPDEGYFPLRQNIAQWLTGFYGPREAITASRICITGGASQNLASILQVFTDPLQTQLIWLVEPAYHLVFRSFEDSGFDGRMRAVPEDEEGMDVHALEAALERHHAVGSNENSSNGYVTKPHRSHRKIYKHIIYCVPSFSNPSGTVMTRPRREALVRLARKFDALIISDDVYDFLSWTGSSRKPVGSQIQRLVDIDRTLDGGPLDRFGNVVSNGSFSKLLGPGCRVGWAEGTEGLVYGISQASVAHFTPFDIISLSNTSPPSGQTKSGGAPSQLISTFINELLESGTLQQHISTKLVPEGHRRYSLMVSAIKERLTGLGVTFSQGPEETTLVGGYYVWVKLPDSIDANQVCQKALETQNLDVGNGGLFAIPGGGSGCKDLHRRLRLCFMWEDGEHLVEGVNRLSLVIQTLLGDMQSRVTV